MTKNMFRTYRPNRQPNEHTLLIALCSRPTLQAKGSSGRSYRKKFGTTLTGHTFDEFGTRMTIRTMLTVPLTRPNAADSVQTTPMQANETVTLFSMNSSGSMYRMLTIRLFIAMTTVRNVFRTIRSN